MSAPHTKDSDCTLLDGQCVVCGVWHGDPCPLCSGRGFHDPSCEHTRNEPEYECPVAGCRLPASSHEHPTGEANYIRLGSTPDRLDFNRSGLEAFERAWREGR